ncbi:MAG: hypothetical protein HYV28_06730 [Ignavibacteriales bacterium]|nr:hypothetical protein [Ignavibacteriales bacterium]
MKKSIVLFFIIIFIAGCSSLYYVNNKGLNDSVGGRLYVAKCSGCHSLYPPAYVLSSENKIRFEVMVKRAKLTGEEEKILKDFLLAAGAR